MLILTSLGRRLFYAAALSAAALVLTTTAAFAQEKQYTEGKSDLALRSEARVDPATLGMSLEIPLGGAPGRAGNSLPVTVRYSSKQWRMKYIGWMAGAFDVKTWTKPKFSENAWAGWTSSLEPPRIEYTGKYQKYEWDGTSYSDNPSAEHFGIWRMFRIQLYLPDGSSHELRKSDAPTVDEIPDFTTGTFYSTDGSRLRFEADSGVLYLPDGSRYFFGGEGTFTRYNNESHNGAWAVQYRDRNGNTINYSLTSVTDTLGRNYDNPLTNTANIPTVQDQSYSVPGFGNVSLTYILRWRLLTDGLSVPVLPADMPYTTNTKCVAPGSYQSLSPYLLASDFATKACADDSRFNPVVLSEIELPNGQKYQFKYNIYGEIEKIIYPTGGYESFVYAAVPALSDLIGPYAQSNRGVIQRRVSAKGDGSDETLWQYSGGDTVRTTAPDNTYADRLLHSSAGGELKFGFNNPLEGMAYDERSYNGSAMLRRTLTKWDVTGPVGANAALDASRDPRPIKQIQLLLDTGGNALAAASTTLYDADLNPISTSSYDYASINATTAQTGAIGSISLGTLVRTQETTYLVNDPAITSTIQQNYRDRQLLGLPSSNRVKNAAGTIMTQSEIKYDEAGYAPLTCGAVNGWTDPSTTVRGMPTTSRSWLNPGGTWLETHAQYDQCGSPVKSWDALGKLSEVAYSGTYQYAYPTSTISVDPDGAGALTALTSSTVYDFTSGKVASTTDANSQTTSFEYAATTPMGQPNQLQRLTKVNRPDGSWTKYNYGYSLGAYFTNTNVSIDATRSTDSYEYADGLGRPRRSFMNEVGTWIVTDTQYDSMGRVWRISNPYRSTQGEEGTVNPSGEWTATTYDALGRASTVTTPDTAVVSSYYSGNQVLVKDQAGKMRMSQTNALGLLKDVWEITPTDTWTEDISFPGHAEVTKAYHTSYAYDVLDNLTTVSQGVQTRTFAYDSLKRLTSAANPESGTINYVYDANSNLTKKTDALGVYTDYTYDGLNRAITKNYSDLTPDVAYAYNDGVTNSKGHLTSVSSSVSGTNYTGFDVMGRVTTATQVTDGQTYGTSYGYNLSGSQSSMSYPSGRVIETKYDAAGRMAGVKDQASGIYYAGASESDTTNQMKYVPHGAVSVMKLGNGLWEHITFNTRLQPTQIGLGTSSTDSSTLGLTNIYGTTNNNGNLQSAGYAGGGLSYTQTFGYDELNRLMTSQEGASWSQTNKYDRYGNRWIDLGGGNQSLYFNTSNRITNGGYVYDAAGNLTNEGTQTFAFDGENKIKTVNGESDVYRYDAEGSRVRKSFTYGEKVRMVYSGGHLIAEYDLSTGALKKEYVYGAKGLIATIEPSLGTKYTTSDHLGTPRVVTNSSAGVVSRHDYKPFGEELGVGIGGRTTGMGYDAADGLRQKFTSKERDNETGLDYFGARYFSSTQGRFTSPDEYVGGPTEMFAVVAAHNPTFYADIAEPQSLNKYQYALNNPLKFIDPDGHQSTLADRVSGGASGSVVPTRGERIRNGAARVARTLQATINGASSAFAENNGLGPNSGSQNQVGRIAGHGLSLAVAGAEVAVGVQGMGAGGAEAILTSPAAATGGGAVLPAIGVATIAASVVVAGHGTAVIVNTGINIFSKKTELSKQPKDRSVEGATDQLTGLQKKQEVTSGAGGYRIRTGKSEQNLDNATKRIKSSKDIKEDQ